MGKGKGKGGEDSAAGQFFGLPFGLMLILMSTGISLVAYKKYADFDEDALKTWVEAPAGCQVSMCARIYVGVCPRALFLSRVVCKFPTQVSER